MPRAYRGRDIFWWMDAAGVLDERHDEVDDLVRARHVPSPQLIGAPDQPSRSTSTRFRRSAIAIVGRLGRVHRRRGPVLRGPRQHLPRSPTSS